MTRAEDRSLNFTVKQSLTYLFSLYIHTDFLTRSLGHIEGCQFSLGSNPNVPPLGRHSEASIQKLVTPHNAVRAHIRIVHATIRIGRSFR